MRFLQTIGLLLVVAAMPATTSAQPGKYAAAVRLEGIEMRSGASWAFPPTGKLKLGEQVIVHHEDGTWVAIVPPAGSVSWVNHRFLGEFDPNGQGKQNALIMADNVEVRIGSDSGLPLGVTQVKLPRGTWVELQGSKAGPKQHKELDSTWYPIAPPEGEYRWLPREALGPPQPLTPPPVIVKNPNLDVPSIGRPTGTLTSSGGHGVAAQDGQWERAEQAERAGDYVTAEKLYSATYQTWRQTNAEPERQLICYNRIIRCQDRIRLDGPPMPIQQTPTVVTVDSRPPATLQPPANTSGPTGVAWPPLATSTAALRTTGVGTLRQASFVIDGKTAYAFNNWNGDLKYYVTAGPGVSLDPYVNRRVDLAGNVQVRGDVRGAEYMVVTQVNPSR